MSRKKSPEKFIRREPPILMQESWYLGTMPDSALLVQIDFRPGDGYVNCRKRYTFVSEFIPFYNVRETPLKDYTLIRHEPEFLSLVRETIKSKGECGGILADWLYENTDIPELNRASWEVFLAVLRKIDPDNTRAATFRIKMDLPPDSAPPVTACPAVPSPAPQPAVPLS